MTQYTVQAPDGKTITLEGPEGASQANVIAQAQQLYKPSASSGQFAETGGGAAMGRPMNRGQLNVLAEPRPLESALAGVTKSAVIDPVLGAAQLLSGGNVGGQAAQSYAAQAKPYQQANPASYLGGQVGGSVLPGLGMAKGAGMIPSFARANPLLQGTSFGAAQGLLTPEETGKTGADYYKNQLGQAAIGATIGAVPTALSKGQQLAGALLQKGVGISTGAGGESLKQAYQAGKAGNETFMANMRGTAPMEDVLNQAKGALSNMKQDLSKEYRLGMMDVSKDKKILNFNEIDKAITDAAEIGRFKGQTINTKAEEALQTIRQTVDDWKNLPAKDFHTPDGMDALKQKVGSILESIPYESGRARTIAQNIYHSIKDEIANQAPVYNQVMKGYAEGQDLVKEISKSLSLGNKASVSTGLNKLQSLMRNNVNTNFGYRQELANKLMEKGGGDLMPALAGQALSSYTPRGLVGQGMDVGAGLTAFSHPGALATIPLTSPRLMGETAYKMGQVASKMPSTNMTNEQKKLAQLLMIKAAQEGVK